jgi:hypothetical protein
VSNAYDKFISVAAATFFPVLFTTMQGGIDGKREVVTIVIAALTAAGVLAAKNTEGFRYSKVAVAVALTVFQAIASKLTDNVITHEEWIAIGTGVVGSFVAWWIKNEGTINGVFLKDRSNARRVA